MRTEQDKIIDAELAAKAAGGDQNAFVILYDKYAGAIFRHIIFRGGDKAVAEDIASQTFMRFWDWLRENKPVKSCKALLYRIAGNLFIDLTRTKEYKNLSLEDMSENKGAQPAAKENIAIDLEKKEEITALKNALNKLPELYKQILTMRYLDELSVAEIAKATGKKSGAIYVSIYRGIKALRQAMVEAKR
ncbi:RNA polymerase sigma factor [Patescibacteria group bacterium]|nr:MAG: RNA polymerase sigma factor [Patescibacteria group bacterium]